MNNMSTREFCHKFNACNDGYRFATKYKTMRECYDALLNREAGDNSISWAIWVFTRPGVTTPSKQRLFAVWCARLVEHLMKDTRSKDALDVAQRYANGEASDDELAAAEAMAAIVAATAVEATTSTVNRHTVKNMSWSAAWAAAAARNATLAMAWDAACMTTWNAACAIAWDANCVTCDAAYNETWDAAWGAQLKHLCDIGNLFTNPTNQTTIMDKHLTDIFGEKK